MLYGLKTEYMARQAEVIQPPIQNPKIPIGIDKVKIPAPCFILDNALGHCEDGSAFTEAVKEGMEVPKCFNS